MTTTTTTTPVELPVIDSPLDPEVAERLGDELLLDTAAHTKTQKVHASGRATAASQSAQARAWTMGGSVD